MAAIYEQPVTHLLTVSVDTPPEGAFTLDTSPLDGWHTLAATTSGGTFDLLPSAVQSLTITQAVEDTGVSRSPQVGTLSLTVLDLAPADRTLVRPGKTITVKATTGAGVRTLFTGIIRGSQVTTDDLHEHTYTTISATDVVADLANQTRYGASSGTTTPDTWAQRINRLLASVPDIPATLNTSYGVTWDAADTVFESSVANHLDMMCNSSQSAAWWPNQFGGIQIVSGFSTANPTYTLQPAHDPRGAISATGLAYLSVNESLDTTALVNEINLVNHQRVLSEEGEWQANDLTTTVQDVTSRATYGAGSAEVDVCIANDVFTPGLGDSLLAFSAQPTFVPTEVRVNAQDNLAIASNIGLMDSVGVQTPDWSGARRITGINHEITSDRWLITYQLGRL